MQIERGEQSLLLLSSSCVAFAHLVSVAVMMDEEAFRPHPGRHSHRSDLLHVWYRFDDSSSS